jgi:anionic cell wall polymer biosynthesis LytR-Cps2A-Psr (LCP) family protein
MLAAAGLAVVVAGAVVAVDRSLTRVDALADYPDRVGPTQGVNWLLVGVDGPAPGSTETDTVMLVHIPHAGPATVVGLPRIAMGRDAFDDSDAAASARVDTPRRLVRTIEGMTGLRVDHYAQLDFSGLARMVDDVGGIPACGSRGACVRLGGDEALDYLRAQPDASESTEGTPRVLDTLMRRIADPRTYLEPTRLVRVLSDGTTALALARGDHLWDLARLVAALRAGHVSVAVSPADPTRANQVFDSLGRDRQLPGDVLARR